jgi:magnesium transporter
VLTVRTYGPDGAAELVDPTTLDGVMAAPGVVVWADLVDPTPQEQALVARAFGLHALSVEDLRKHRQRPKIDRYEDHALLVAYGVAVHEVATQSNGADTPGGPAAPALADLLVELDVVVGDDWVLTARERTADGAVDLRRVVEAMAGRTERHDTTVGVLVHALVDAVVDSYFDVSDEVDRRLSDLEALIFSDGPDDARHSSPADQDRRDRHIQRTMLSLRNDLVQLRRRIAPLYDVLQAVLRGEAGALDREVGFRVQDVVDHVLRVTESIDVHHELLSNAFDAHLALVAQHTNDTMRRMTAWGSILLGATLIAGIYGMNFREMPELRWELGYPFAITSMAVLSLVLWWSFRRKRWL